MTSSHAQYLSSSNQKKANRFFLIICVAVDFCQQFPVDKLPPLTASLPLIEQGQGEWSGLSWRRMYLPRRGYLRAGPETDQRTHWVPGQRTRPEPVLGAGAVGVSHLSSILCRQAAVLFHTRVEECRIRSPKQTSTPGSGSQRKPLAEAQKPPKHHKNGTDSLSSLVYRKKKSRLKVSNQMKTFIFS